MKVLSVVLFVFVFKSLSFAAQLKETPSHSYLIIPFHEMIQSRRMKLINDVQSVLISELSKHMPDDELSRSAINLLRDGSDDITSILGDLDGFVDEKVRDHETLQSVYSLYDAVPSAFVLLVGGKFTVNFKLGGGGSATFAIVVVPSKIIKTNKITNKVEEYYALRCGIVVLPVLNIGGGFGGGATVRAGAGLIWGDLQEPENFYGTSIGISGSLSAGVGNNFKIAMLLGLTGLKNIYATGTWEAGMNAELSAHLNIGAIVPINEFLKTINVFTGDDERPKSVLDAN